MTTRRSQRRYRKTADRRVWVFSELNRDLQATDMAALLVRAAQAQAIREAEAQRQHLEQQAQGDAE